MKKAQSQRQERFGRLKKKTFQAVLVQKLRELLPAIGELSAHAMAKEIEALVDQFHPPGQNLRMGQVLWPAVDERETGGWGKTIENSRLKPVILDAVTADDLDDLIAGGKARELRKKVTVRCFEQAYAQGGVLTGVDVAALLRLSPATVFRYVKEYETEHRRLLPRRGSVHDIGPTLTHKREICRRVIVEGASIETTALETNHSPEAVTRYVQDYRRVVACLKNGFSIADTAYATKMSQRLVKEYQNLIHSDLPSDPEDVIP
jgi:predicted transcriptional regulator